MSGILSPAAEKVQDLFRVGDQDKRDGIERIRPLSNAGLIWQRYLEFWDGSTLVEGEERRKALLRFAEDVSHRNRTQKPSSSHPRRLLETLHARQERILGCLSGEAKGATHAFTLTSRLSMGHGSPHPTEIGFTFDRTIGVPYLPGSSVKGLCRAAASLLDLAPSLTEELFGPERIEEDAPGSIGDLVFLDAYPSSLPVLEVDVINCHHPAYYGGAADYPAETEDPVPVYFLTVASGAEWRFRVVSRSGEHAGRVVDLLRAGLTELGAGAKTAVGYGVFAR